jgi:hypothetical protein
MSFSYGAEAKRTGFDLGDYSSKLFKKLRFGSYPRRSHRVSAGAHCPSDRQSFWQLADPGIAEVTSPAGIARKPDRTTPAQASLRIDIIHIFGF